MKWSDTELELIEKQAPDLSNNKVVQAFPEFNKLQIEQFVDNSINNMTAGTMLVVSIPFNTEAFFRKQLKIFHLLSLLPSICTETVPSI